MKTAAAIAEREQAPAVDGASWADWRDQIAKACDGSHHSIDAIERDLAAGLLQALMAPGCCLLVQVQNYPSERACQVMWAAGTLDAIKAGIPALHEWAKAQGCTEMLVEGHPGWKRALEALGYAPWSITLRRPL